jgi:pyridoxal phosphate phosphatase PHOSPHO2
MVKGKDLIVFDFDWSFVDQDTDRWVLEILSTKARRGWQTGMKEAPCFMPSIT